MCVRFSISGLASVVVGESPECMTSIAAADGEGIGRGDPNIMSTTSQHKYDVHLP